MSTLIYPLSITGGNKCPVDYLDHVVYKGVKPEVQYYCLSTGEPLSSASYKLALSNAANKLYPGTDHAPMLLTIKWCEISVRQSR